jgi:hypothetical protein
MGKKTRDVEETAKKIEKAEIDVPDNVIYEILRQHLLDIRGSWTLYNWIILNTNCGGILDSVALQVIAPIAEATRLLVIVRLYEIFDENTKLYCLKTLFLRARQEGALDDLGYQHFEKRRSSMRQEVNGISLLRGNLFGHTSLKLHRADVFKMAKLDVEKVTALITLVFSILEEIAPLIHVKPLKEISVEGTRNAATRHLNSLFKAIPPSLLKEAKIIKPLSD